MSATGTTRWYDAFAPVVMQEMRSLMRGWQAPGALLLCTALAAAAEVAVFFQTIPDTAAGVDPQIIAQAGRAIYQWVTGLEAALVVLLAPLLTVQAITDARRRGTLEGLLLTRLTPRDLVRGKLVAATGFLLVVILCVVPVQAIVVLLGGVAPVELVFTSLLLMAST